MQKMRRNARWLLRPTRADQPPLLGGAQGKKSQNRKPQHVHFVPMFLIYRYLGLHRLRFTIEARKKWLQGACNE